MARFGSAARGDPLYEVGVGIGRLLRTIFLADYFVKPAFRRELLRVLNRDEATNALKRLIYTGRVANYQAKSEDEMQAVADALNLRHGVEHGENAIDLRSLGEAPKRGDTAGIDRTMRPDAHRGSEHARHFPPSLAITRARKLGVSGSHQRTAPRFDNIVKPQNCTDQILMLKEGPSAAVHRASRAGS